MIDILALAQSRRQTLTAELRRIDDFLAMADDLMRAPTAQAGRDDGAASAENTAAEPDIMAVAEPVQPVLPRVAQRNKLPTDPLFQKILADQRAQRAAMEQDTLHFGMARAASG